MTTHLPHPLSRKDMQQLTRERLIFAARAVFAEDGYHGAKLDKIATEAGFSKGAVYSNFSGKAELFLAVMDENTKASLESSPETDSSLTGLVEGDPAFDEAVRGFGLATLEFIAMAARDPHLREECGKRIDMVAQGYAAMAEEMGAENQDLTAQEMGALFFALDQGSAVISLAGSSAISARTLNRGLAALLGLPFGETKGDDGKTAFHYDKVRQNIAANLAGGQMGGTTPAGSAD